MLRWYVKHFLWMGMDVPEREMKKEIKHIYFCLIMCVAMAVQLYLIICVLGA